MSTLLQPLGASTPLVREPCWRSSAHALLFHPSSSPRASSLHLATNAVILLSTACFVAESFVAWHHWGGWTVINGAVCLLFTGEYALRLFLVPYGKGDEMAPPRRPSASARLHFMRQPLSIVDALSVAPFWLEIAISPLGSLPPLAFLQLLRALRLVRVLRLLRLAEECTELAALARCAASTLPLLRLLLLFLALEAVTLGGLAFHAESWELDETGELWLAAGGMGEASDFQNILDAMWWTVVTVSTVGYLTRPSPASSPQLSPPQLSTHQKRSASAFQGDMCPRTFLGRVLACIAMLTGVVGLSALVSILARAKRRLPFGSTAQPWSDSLAERLPLLIHRQKSAFERCTLPPPAPSRRSLSCLRRDDRAARQDVGDVATRCGVY
ncbi:MAG: hypothetical protein SGPRY_005690 [Prymnesium sp.]